MEEFNNQVAVIGSSNVDLVMKMERLPCKGETVTNAQFLQTFGGKGANQAVACVRAGAKTLFMNCAGEDPYVEQMLRNFVEDGMDCTCIERFEGMHTGHALCMIGEKGANYLSVAPGANYCMTPEWISKYASRLQSIPIWVLQCEIPVESNRYLLEGVKTPQNRIIWNFAPFVSFPDIPLRACDILIVNEIEASQLSEVAVSDRVSAFKAAESLRSRGVRNVIITLGSDGSVYLGAENCLYQPVFDVDVVDTVAAGDTFCGSLACALSEGMEWKAALKFATAAASLTVTRLGAQPSIPLRSEIDQFLQNQLEH